MGYPPQGHKKTDTTEATEHACKPRSGRNDLHKWPDCLFNALFLIGGTPTPFPSGCVSLPFASVSTNCFSLCSPGCCTVSLIIDFVPLSTVFASLRNAFFNGARAPGILLLASCPWGTSGYDSWFSSRLPRVNSWAGHQDLTLTHTSLASLWDGDCRQTSMALVRGSVCEGRVGEEAEGGRGWAIKNPKSRSRRYSFSLRTTAARWRDQRETQAEPR